MHRILTWAEYVMTLSPQKNPGSFEKHIFTVLVFGFLNQNIQGCVHLENSTVGFDVGTTSDGAI